MVIEINDGVIDIDIDIDIEVITNDII